MYNEDDTGTEETVVNTESRRAICRKKIGKWMLSVKDNLKLLVKYIMRFFLKIYWVFPVKRKTVFFMSNMGKGYLCNPKYIYQSMVADKRFENYRFIWCFVNPDMQDSAPFSPNTEIIKKGEYIRFFYYLLTSEVVIYNCGGFSYAPIRKNQFLIETGHGGGLQKRNGFMVKTKSSASNKGIALACKDIKLWIASDEMHGKIYVRKAMGYNGEILKSGYPRSDIFFEKTEVLRDEIKKRLGVEKDAYVVLYAPTFKGSEEKAVSLSEDAEIIDVPLVKRVLHERFGGKWLFVTRGHLYSQSVPVGGIDSDWTSYSDMQELLLVADVLITDYSSCVWDFFLLGKPTFLYVPDRGYYEGKDRGFYMPLEKWPGTIVDNNGKWRSVVSNYDEVAYKEKLDVYRKLMNPYENGNACSLVKDRILKQIEG